MNDLSKTYIARKVTLHGGLIPENAQSKIFSRFIDSLHSPIATSLLHLHNKRSKLPFKSTQLLSDQGIKLCVLLCKRWSLRHSFVYTLAEARLLAHHFFRKQNILIMACNFDFNENLMKKNLFTCFLTLRRCHRSEI